MLSRKHIACFHDQKTVESVEAIVSSSTVRGDLKFEQLPLQSKESSRGLQAGGSPP